MISDSANATRWRNMSLPCREFLKRPSLDYFFRPKTRPDIRKLSRIMKERKTRLLLVSFRRPGVIDDVLWPQLRRTARRLSDILEEYEFGVIGWSVYGNGRSFILLELGVWELPGIRKLRGPRIFVKDRSRQFRSKYKSGRIWVENDCWVAEVRRSFTEAHRKLRDTLSDPVKELRAKGIASYIAKEISGGFRILGNEEILKLARKDTGFAGFLLGYFGKKL